MIKRTSLALALFIMPALALAQVPVADQANAAPVAQTQPVTTSATPAAQDKGIFVTDPTTGERRKLALDDARNPDMLASVLPKIEGVETLIRAYVAQGYAPFHAYILTNGDLMDILKKSSPNLTVNPTLVQKIQSVRDLYQTKE